VFRGETSLAKLIMYGLLLWFAIWGYRQYHSPSSKVRVGQRAPDFALPDANGHMHRLADWQGKWLILYFYPKDDTPGCTREACHFRDDSAQFKALGASVVGVSVDSVSSHADFASKHQLPFPLLADSAGTVAAAYGALFNLFVFQAAKRMTFLIDPQGNVAQMYSSVDPDIHSQQLLADLKRLSAF
jgi:thioredoxin-dependent peroxiredoxin